MTHFINGVPVADPAIVDGIRGQGQKGPAKISLSRSDILDNAKTCICVDRARTYGEPGDNFSRVAAYWTPFLSSRTGPLTPKDVAILMCLFKLARLQHDPTSLDGWVDAVGYLALGGELALAEAK